MNEEDAIVKFLLIYKQTGIVTRPEVGQMIGKGVNQIAGVCGRNRITGWPDVLPEVKQLRKCCFLVSKLDAINPRLCPNQKVSPEEFRCEDHVGAVYQLLTPPQQEDK
jgi:hypothetical protein